MGSYKVPNKGPRTDALVLDECPGFGPEFDMTGGDVGDCMSASGQGSSRCNADCTEIRKSLKTVGKSIRNILKILHVQIRVSQKI